MSVRECFVSVFGTQFGETLCYSAVLSLHHVLGGVDCGWGLSVTIYNLGSQVLALCVNHLA